MRAATNRNRYRNGKDCRRGHHNPLRYMANSGCIACHRIREKIKAGYIAFALPPKRKTARQLAAARGDQTFDLGIACVNGHGTWRYTSNAACIECSAIRATQRGAGWQQRNRDAKRQRYQEDAAYREILKKRTGAYYRNVVAVDPERVEEDRERGRRNYRRNPGATAVR